MPDDDRSSGRHFSAGPFPAGDGRRHLAEIAIPAAVILAGVLVVVAFGIVVARAMRSDPPAALPLPQPPALGGLDSSPPDQAVIPLPSPSSSSPSPSPSPTRATSPPPPATSPPPDTGTVTVARGDVPAVVDLPSEGRRDWVHWGQQNAFSQERDADGGFDIVEGRPQAPRFRHALSPQRFRWEGGSPVPHSDGTPTGIRTCGDGNGFTLSAPAGTGERTLRVYVGVFAGRGRLEAALSTGGGTRVQRLEERDNRMSTAMFVIDYRAPRDGRLTVTWRTDRSFDDDCGGVALEAATLR
ncbi:hypothetical protein [Mangrovihabitans endophyticus]|uniref:NPCBM/NEW2 domain-containing protein n=1 Tax=Mangrovihabitans endophyticus TaxID=1751298 RepID=A0A8J3C0K3_9ACTN|nr:hypothetical protein [Mangrovihabitans endophyticus]GGK91717.1 hypothetical protein GCM10012284_27040 [Mangrovihabitans endophyticus]